jgi:hypothetical protein
LLIIWVISWLRAETGPALFRSRVSPKPAAGLSAAPVKPPNLLCEIGCKRAGQQASSSPPGAGLAPGLAVKDK